MTVVFYVVIVSLKVFYMNIRLFLFFVVLVCVEKQIMTADASLEQVSRPNNKLAQAQKRYELTRMLERIARDVSRAREKADRQARKEEAQRNAEQYYDARTRSLASYLICRN